MENTFDEYESKIRSRDRLRLIIIGVYILLTILYIVLWVVLPFDDTISLVIYLSIIFGGFFILMGVLIYPYYRPISRPLVPDGIVVGSADPEQELADFYHEDVHITMLVWINIPMAVLFMGMAIIFGFNNDLATGLIFLASGLFFILIQVMFNKITLLCNPREVKVKMGPFSETIAITQITSIRSTSIKPIGTYLGIGKRVGADGSIGWIAGTKTGVRLEMKEGKSRVLSSKKPQGLVDYIRLARIKIHEK